MNDIFSGMKIGYAMTGSFCAFSRSFEQAELLRDMGAELIPIMSGHASTISTRFGKAEDNVERLASIAGRSVITTIEDAEPIGPKDLTDIMVVAPCTSNTAAKLASSITDTPVILKTLVKFQLYFNGIMAVYI